MAKYNGVAGGSIKNHRMISDRKKDQKDINTVTHLRKYTRIN